MFLAQFHLQLNRTYKEKRECIDLLFFSQFPSNVCTSTYSLSFNIALNAEWRYSLLLNIAGMNISKHVKSNHECTANWIDRDTGAQRELCARLCRIKSTLAITFISA